MINIDRNLPLQTPQFTPQELHAKTRESFAQIFMGVVLTALREAQPAQGLFDGPESSTFRSMLDDALLQQKSNWQALGVHLASGLSQEKPRP